MNTEVAHNRFFKFKSKFKYIDLKFISVLLLVIGLSACAHQRRVIVDMQGVDTRQYQADLFDCQQYAQQVEKKAGAGAVGGAVVGALIGAAIGNHRTAEKLAGAGAVSGAVKGGAATKREKALVVRRCLAGRGYKVLN